MGIIHMIEGHKKRDRRTINMIEGHNKHDRRA
jgi:hypothetical protein